MVPANVIETGLTEMAKEQAAVRLSTLIPRVVAARHAGITQRQATMQITPVNANLQVAHLV